MKTFSLFIPILVGFPPIVTAQTTSVAGDDNHTYYTKQFYLPGKVQGITVRTTTGQALASIKVPENVVLSIYSSDQDRLPAIGREKVPAFRTEFHGKISIRTKPHAPDRAPIGAVELMADAPFRVDLADAIVSVETLPDK